MMIAISHLINTAFCNYKRASNIRTHRVLCGISMQQILPIQKIYPSCYVGPVNPPISPILTQGDFLGL